MNEHGAVNFNDLYTRDPARSAEFYDAVFGWELIEPNSGMFCLNDLVTDQALDLLLGPGRRLQEVLM